ncbi:SusC/RagA family TonB-linked outer membrane protein [Algoriphagus resistens]|uniref:SusC/RagA family TonB-linked outer membrane protein n=1 Tax=Algoriphagus resistens TaxID=1750590 RepID=UPI000AF8B387|nr:TonB-dependent receptor [Algoriphagus resistens]
MKKILPLIVMSIKLLARGIALLCISINPLLANTSKAQVKSIDKVFLKLEKHPRSLVKFFNEIEKKTEFKFFYTYEAIRPDSAISYLEEYESVENHLYYIASQTELRFKQVNNAISVIRKPTQDNSLFVKRSDGEIIRGTVKDSFGVPMPGVSVLVKGTSEGTVTELDGSFSIEVDPGQTLLFSFIGYERKEILVNSDFVLEVVMVEEENSLDEFVVVGYGTVKKKDITGAVSAIESEELKDQPVVSIDQAIAGRLAGVVVTQATGAPGGGASVRIRGAGSLSAGNEPLYVVDGFPVTNDFDQRNNPLNTINPADIDNIQVLKDASATAIYGSRGSNGVVLITTKSGKEGQAKIELNVSSGFQQVEKTLDVLNASEFATYINEARNNAWVNSGPGRSASDPNANRIQNVMYLIPEGFENPQSLGEGTNWQDAIFRTARMSDYRLNFSGGNAKTRYFVSAGYLEQEGVIINSDLKRYSFRVNVESQMNERVKVGVNITPSYTFSNQSLAEGNWQGGGIIQSAITAGPHLTPYDSDGNYTKITGQGIGTSEVDNPVKIAREYFHQQKNLRLLGTAFTEISLIDDLKFKALVGTDIRSFREDIFSSSIINPNSVNLTRPAVGSNNTAQTVNWLSEFTLSYGKTLGKHTFDAVLGYTIQKEKLEASQITGTNFANDNIKTTNAAGLITRALNTEEEWSLLSFLARLNYNYDDRYLLTATFRQDGSSRFGSDNRWGAFPSLSLGWRLSEEDFLNQVSWLSELRLRASYGLTGNNFISNYGAIGLTAIENYPLGTSISNGIRLANVPNSTLGWEKNKQLDFGLESGVFQNRIYLAADYYIKRTSDLLLNVPVPTLTGYTNALQNIGEIKNKGIEFTLTSRNLVSDFTWTTDFNIAFNQIEVMALGPDGSPIISRQATSSSSPTHITQIGSVPGSFYGYQVIGVYQNQEDVENSAVVLNGDGTVQSIPGRLKFADINGDGIINTDDRTILGDPFPDFTYGMTNRFSFRNVDFSFTLQGVQGFEVLNLARRYYGNYAGSYNVLRSASNGWKSETDRGDGTSPMIDRNFNAYAGSNVVNNVTSQFVEDGSFLRIRNITIGYTFPATILERIKVSNARLNFTVQNAYTFTKYEGFNPEVSAQGGNPLVPGVDAGGYPLARTYMLGLTIGF